MGTQSNLATSEKGLLAFFLLVSVYMFIESNNYPDILGLYPQVMSGIVILASLLLFFQRFLPPVVREFVADSGQAIGSRDEDFEEFKEEHDKGQKESENTSKNQIVLTGFIGGYLLLSYLVGMYYATPVFVLAYGFQFEIRWWETFGLALMSTGIAYVFYDVFNAPIASGVLL